MSNYIVEEVKEVILNSGYSIAEISRLSGIAVQTIRNWTNGVVFPTLDKIQTVLNSIGYTLVLEEIYE